MIVKELITKLGFDVDEKTLDKWDARVGLLTTALGAVVVAAGAAGAAIVGFAHEAAERADELGKLRKQTKATAFDIQALQYAADQSETSIEAVGNALVFMRKTTGKSGLDEFLKQADRLNNLPEQMQVEEAMKVFGRGGKEILPLIAEGTDKIRALVDEYKQLGIALTDDQIEKADQFGDSLSQVRTILKGLRMQIGVEFLPVLQDAVNQFREWYAANHEIIKQRVVAFLRTMLAVLRPIAKIVGVIFSILGDVFDMIVKLEPLFRGLLWSTVVVGAGLAALRLLEMVAALRNIATWLGIVQVLTTNWMGAISAMLKTWAFLTTPIALLVAFLALVGLIIQDILIWQEGGDSLIGEWVGTWAEFLDMIDKVVGGVADAWDAVQDKTVAMFVSLRNLWQGFVGWVTGIWDAFITNLLDRIDSVVAGAKSVAAFFGVSSGVRDGALTAPTVSGVGSGSTTSIQQRNSVRVVVPPGTNKEQADFVTTAVRTAIGDAWQPIADAYPELEYGN